MERIRTSRGGRAGRLLAWRWAVAGAAAACVTGGVALAVTSGHLHVGVNTSSRVEMVKTIPISRRAWQKPRVVASLAPDELGSVDQGDTVAGFGEVEVSVTCLEPMPQCVGSLYDYSPRVKGRFVLGDTATSAHGFEVGKPVKYECSQDLPNRNHHCVITVSRSAPIDKDPGCRPCHLNLVVSAFHGGARRHDKLVVGADGDDGIHQGKASISGAVFGSPPSALTNRRLVATHSIVTRRLPVASSGSGPRRVLLSVRLDDLRAGEMLLIDAHAWARIAHLHYSTLMQSQLIVSRKRGSISRAKGPGVIMSWQGKGDAMNGFNCTRGPSGYHDPCPIHKVAAMKVLHDATTKPLRGTGRRIPLFLNLVTGAAKEFGGTWHSSDYAKVKRGTIRIWRYPAEYRG